MDNVIAGDAKPCAFSHASVKTESITATILRGKEEKKEKVFILSYVSAFMTSDDWEMLSDEKVIVVDNHHVIREGMRHRLKIAGPGVVAYGIANVVSDMWEFRKKEVVINYSENLLNRKCYDVAADSPPVHYLLTVAPGMSLYPKNEKMKDYLTESGVAPALHPCGVSLVNRLEDLRSGDYFAPIGKEVVGRFPVVVLGPKLEVPYRTVMCTPEDGYASKKLSQMKITHCVRMGYAYFYYDKEMDATFSWEILTGTIKAKGTLKFSGGRLPKMGIIVDADKVTVYYEGILDAILPLKPCTGTIDTSSLDTIKNVTPELIRELLCYIPYDERQYVEGYGSFSGSWAEFKKRQVDTRTVSNGPSALRTKKRKK